MRPNNFGVSVAQCCNPRVFCLGLEVPRSRPLTGGPEGCGFGLGLEGCGLVLVSTSCLESTLHYISRVFRV